MGLHPELTTKNPRDLKAEIKPKRIIALLISLLTIVTCMLVVIGWIFNVQSFKSVLPGVSNMRFNAALCFLCLGVVLFILNKSSLPKQTNRLRTLLLSVVFLVGILTICEYLFNSNLGLDQLFWRQSAGNVEEYPGRMSPGTAVNFCLFALILFFLPNKKMHWWIQALLVLMIPNSFLVIVTYLSGTGYLTYMPFLFSTDLHSAFLFLLLITGIFFSDHLSTFHFSFQQKIIVFFFTILLTLFFIFTAYIKSSQQLRKTFLQVQHNNDVLMANKQVISQMHDIELGATGFVLTKDDNYLRSYLKARDSIASSLHFLKNLTSDNPTQQIRIEGLKRLVERSKVLSANVVSIRQNKGVEAAIAELNKPKGQWISDSIRNLSAQIEQTEKYILDARKKANLDIFNNPSKFIFVFQVIAGLLLLAIFILIIQNSLSRDKVEKALRKSEGFINALVSNAGNPISVRDLEGKYLLANKPVQELLNRAENEIVGKHFSEFLSPVLSKNLLKTDTEVITTGKKVTVNTEALLNNEMRYFTGNYFPLFDEFDKVYAVCVVSTEVTDIKRSEEQLKIYKHFFDFSNDICVIADIRGYFEIVNPTMQKVLGYSHEEIVAKPFIEFVHPDDIALTLEVYEKQQTRKHPILNFTHRFKKKDGNYVWLDWNSAPNHEKGKIYAIGRDITEKKLLDEKLAALNQELEKRVEQKTNELLKQELHFKSIMDELVEGVQIIGFDWCTLYANEALLKLARYTGEEMIGTLITELYPGIEQTELYKHYQQCMHNRTTYQFETEFVFPDKHQGWFSITVQPAPDGIFILLNDISERKIAEERLRLALQAGKIGWWELDMVKGTSVRNIFHDEIFGHKKLLPQWGIKDFFNHIISEDQSMVKQAFEDALDTLHIDLECGIVWNDQSMHFIQVKGEIKNPSKIDQCMRGIVVDITERKKAEKDLLQTNEELHELSSHLQNVREEERINIAREIHDDLGQQLTGLKMDMFSLARKMKSTDEVIIEKTKSVIHLIDEIVKSVRRIATNLRPSILDDLGLVAALVWHSKEVERRAEIKVSFSSDVEEEIPANITTGLFRIFQEALTNAVRHANAQEITTTLTMVNGELVLTIKDDGKGMDLESVASKKTLGLIGIKERTFLLGGRCDITSKPGEGTKLRVTVPLGN